MQVVLYKWVDDLTSETALEKAGLWNPKFVTRLLSKCKKVEGRKMSNTDNMRTVAVLSSMVIHDQYIEGDGRGPSDEKPAEPITVIDRLEQSSS